MRRISVIAAALLTTVALLTTLIVRTTSAANRPRPSLALHGTAPVVVDGAHFHRGERVKLTSSAGQSVTARANSSGTFKTSLRWIPVDRCSGLIVRAQGSTGSRAVARRPPLPECLPARTQSSLA